MAYVGQPDLSVGENVIKLESMFQPFQSFWKNWT